MARPVTLFTGQWADLPLEEMARKAKEFGYDGIELACWGDHFEVDKALTDDDYCSRKRELLESYDLQVLCHQQPPGRPGRAATSSTSGTRSILPALRLGRRQSGRRERAGGRGDEEHGPRRPETGRRASSTASPARASGT